MTRISKRQSEGVRAARAATLLDDPNLRVIFDEVRAQYIRDIECTNLDGDEKSALAVLESVRKLQALLDVKRVILRPLVQQSMKGDKQPSR